MITLLPTVAFTHNQVDFGGGAGVPPPGDGSGREVPVESQLLYSRDPGNKSANQAQRTPRTAHPHSTSDDGDTTARISKQSSPGVDFSDDYGTVPGHGGVLFCTPLWSLVGRISDRQNQVAVDEPFAMPSSMHSHEGGSNRSSEPGPYQHWGRDGASVDDLDGGGSPRQTRDCRGGAVGSLCMFAK